MDSSNKTAESSDKAVLDYLRRHRSASVAELARVLEVTATAIRQRLTRLTGEGMIRRESVRSGRGRPAYRYLLTTKGVQSAGTNYSDLAGTLWEEIRGIDSPEVRRGLLKRIATRLAETYANKVSGATPDERLASLAALMNERDIPCEFDDSGDLPVLSALACPYPELAEKDRGICAMERMFFSELTGGDLSLTECRLDGATCCTFEGASS